MVRSQYEEAGLRRTSSESGRGNCQFAREEYEYLQSKQLVSVPTKCTGPKQHKVLIRKKSVINDVAQVHNFFGVKDMQFALSFNKYVEKRGVTVHCDS